MYRKAVFERIYVKDKAIAEIKLNPPFSIFFQKDIERLFKNHPTEAAKEDVFEQIVGFTLSEKYVVLKELIFILAEKRKLI